MTTPPDHDTVPALDAQPGTPAAMTAVLDLTETATDVWRTEARTGTASGRMFGGEVAAQALASAQATVPDDRFVHSLHGYFILPGDPDVPTHHRIRRVRDGGSFTTRIVESVQGDAAVFTMSASFQRPEEPAIRHQFTDLEVAPPGDSATAAQVLASASGPVTAWLTRVAEHFPWEFRFPPDTLVEQAPDGHDGEQRPAVPSRTWFRLRGDLPRDHPQDHAAALTYLSDMFLLGSALRPHGILFEHPGLFVTSLDHNVWFHTTPRVGDWLLYDTRSVWADNGRALCRGRFWTTDGRLVATVAQEGLVRMR